MKTIDMSNDKYAKDSVIHVSDDFAKVLRKLVADFSPTELSHAAKISYHGAAWVKREHGYVERRAPSIAKAVGDDCHLLYTAASVAHGYSFIVEPDDRPSGNWLKSLLGAFA